MSKFIDNFYALIFISIGAVLGSYLRMKIHNFSESILSKKYLGTLISNNLSVFLLALFLSLNLKIHFFQPSDYVLLAIYIGFLGSLSTFSTFIMDLLESIFDKKWKEFYLISLFSLFGGIFSAFMGYKLANFAI